MKISISLSDEDVEFLDQYARKSGSSRSAVVHLAVRLLRATQLGDAYAEAWDEWSGSGEAEVWDVTIADGLGES